MKRCFYGLAMLFALLFFSSAVFSQDPATPAPNKPEYKVSLKVVDEQGLGGSAVKTFADALEKDLTARCKIKEMEPPWEITITPRFASNGKTKLLGLLLVKDTKDPRDGGFIMTVGFPQVFEKKEDNDDQLKRTAEMVFNFLSPPKPPNP